MGSSINLVPLHHCQLPSSIHSFAWCCEATWSHKTAVEGRSRGPNSGPPYTPSGPIRISPQTSLPLLVPFLLADTEVEGEELGSGLGPDPCTP